MVSGGVVFGVDEDMLRLFIVEPPDIDVGVEWRFEAVLGCVDSCLTGYEDEDAEAEDTARARPACVSRRRLGPSFTFG